MPHNHLTEGKKEPISWVIHRTVCRSPILLKGFEVHPHGVCWIRQSAVCESVRGKKVAEFVSNFGLRNRQNRKQRQTKSQPQASDQNHRQNTVLSKSRKSSFN